MLPFSHEQFLAVFAAYNTAVWPAQVAAYIVGLGVCVLMLSRFGGRSLWVAGGLAALWVWTGAMYHGLFFSRINGLAIAFAALFVVEGLLLAIAGATRRLEIGATAVSAWRAAIGWSLIAYSLFLYPAIGVVSGMTYPAAPVFGITPCPLTLFTWGVLLMARAVPWWLVVIPSAWALLGGSAAFLLHVPQDWPLFATSLFFALVPRGSRAVLRVR
jgi:hypothetical protein